MNPENPPDDRQSQELAITGELLVTALAGDEDLSLPVRFTAASIRLTRALALANGALAKLDPARPPTQNEKPQQPSKRER